MEQNDPNYINNNMEEIPDGISLKNIYLPNIWILYLYDKQIYKKMANNKKKKPNINPHKEIYQIRTVNDIEYILRLFKIETEQTTNNYNKLNLDMNDYIIMRQGIEPIWEDPKNSNGGTFTIKIDHKYGYDTWATFIKYMVGETLTNEMNFINGITTSFIEDNRNIENPGACYTYIKIWDGKLGRSRDQFIEILPAKIINIIGTASLMYSQNQKKGDFNKKNIMFSLMSGKQPPNKGKFINYNKKR